MNMTVIDAVMGAGKSTFIISKIKHDTKRYIVVLPTLEEIRRYYTELNDFSAVKLDDEKRSSKTERFVEALSHARVILLTHKLFEDFLQIRHLEQIVGRGWTLVIDELPTAFQDLQEKGRGYVELLCSEDYLQVRTSSDLIQQLVPSEEKYRYFIEDSDYDKPFKEVLRKANIMDLLKIGGKYYLFALKKEKLAVFEKVYIATYPFLGSGLDSWCKLHGITVSHMKLDNGVLRPHNGLYSGRNFRHLIRFREYTPRGRNKPYGHAEHHFSATQQRDVFNRDTRSAKSKAIQKELQARLRKLHRRDSNMVDDDDFLFVCRKDSVNAFANHKYGLSQKFLDKCWVPYNCTATNDYQDRHHIAYYYNVYDFPNIAKALKEAGIETDMDMYALHTMVQCIWRSAIRKGETIYLDIPSTRMRRILDGWLNACDEECDTCRDGDWCDSLKVAYG